MKIKLSFSLRELLVWIVRFSLTAATETQPYRVSSHTTRRGECRISIRELSIRIKRVGRVLAETSVKNLDSQAVERLYDHTIITFPLAGPFHLIDMREWN
jgi:hypothetical protein